MHVPKKYAALASAGLIALALSACASEQPTTPTDADAAAETEVVPASTFTELVEQMEATQEEASSVHMEMTYSGELAKATGMDASTSTADVAYGGSLEETTMQMSMSMMGMDMDMILVDGVMYLGMGELSDNKYVSMSFEDLKAEPGMTALLEQLDSIDPAAQAEAMADAVTKFEHTGTEQVDGVEAEVYTMTVDPTKIDAAAAGLDEFMAGETDESMADVGKMTIVYAIGPDGLPLQSDVTMKIDGQKLVVESAYSAWGEPVDVEAPPKGEVVPYSEFAPQG